MIGNSNYFIGKIVFFKLFLLLLILQGCRKEPQELSIANNLIKKEYKAFLNGKEIILNVEFKEDGREIRFDKRTPKYVTDFFEKCSASMIAHVVNNDVYYYSNQEEFQKAVIFDTNVNKMRLKAYNGGIAQFFEHPLSANNGGRYQTDELLTMGWVTMPYSPTLATFYTLNQLYGNRFLPSINNYSVPLISLDWHGATPWVGSGFNDQITAVRVYNFDRGEPVHAVCSQHINYGGYRLVISKSVNGLSNQIDLRGIIMSYGFAWSTNWNDEISSHYTIQCPASVIGQGHTVQI